MGIYSSKAFTESANNTVEVEPQLYSESMGLMETTYCILAESEANWNTFMKAVGLQELSYMESYGEEMVYTEGTASDFFTRAKDWFKRLFAKIKGLFEKFVAKIRSYISSDADFIRKYEDKIRQGAGKIPSTAEFKGYKFENIHKFMIPDSIKESTTDYSAYFPSFTALNNETKIDKLKEDIKEWRSKNKEEELDKKRALLLGKSDGKISSSDFMEELTDYLKGDKETFDDTYLSNNYKTFIDEIKDSKKSINTAKDEFNNIKKNINEAIREVEKHESGYKDNIKDETVERDKKLLDQKITIAQEMISFYKDILQIYTTANGKHLEFLKQYNRQCKAICVKLVGFANRQSSENASYNYFQSERHVGGITLV